MGRLESRKHGALRNNFTTAFDTPLTYSIKSRYSVNEDYYTTAWSVFK